MANVDKIALERNSCVADRTQVFTASFPIIYRGFWKTPAK